MKNRNINWSRKYSAFVIEFIESTCTNNGIPYQKIEMYDFEDPESLSIDHIARVYMNCDAKSAMRYWDVLSVKTHNWVKAQIPKTRKSLMSLYVSVDWLNSSS